MKITRQKEFVQGYHYDARNTEWEKENGTPETELNVSFQLHGLDEEKSETTIAATLQFQLVFDNYVITGIVSQLNQIHQRLVKAQADLNQSEVEELAAPLFDIVKRLTYEVTEIAMDEPGLQLNFEKK
ncbi:MULTISPECIES: DUF1149 family protein [unclassified Enterococcus]|uniref:DUF1149 family protein n=1 Tax=unclassified Enterococcus TaxID=2608891 RepID=UPI001555B456|nr:MULTISPECIES: DUF1149 family protein [unclassified Enterococcus]MBS7577316.1 DUF1149 family protein [Enterococcus sp. MMGLQ5-2]MBS7584591.1 DUF1149 family protein [Enterococcus sp. MMGLQ5-1]NPD12446.1 DUF1149 family protein [Enterococcus sp. MMGLQ5-1]NPD37150.1 DUF1149 family protein [Enterococcus sp. MMGLQ5-2]